MPSTRRRRSKSLPARKSKRRQQALRRNSNESASLIEEQIRMKHAEYRLALLAKAKRYGNVDDANAAIILEEDYFISEPTGWDEATMGEWSHGDVRPPSNNNAAAEDDNYIPPPPSLHRSENNGRIAVFNDHYERSFNTLIDARNRMRALESNDVDIHNALVTVQKVSRAKKGHHQVGKSEVMKTILNYMGPNRTNYTVMTKPPSLRRAQTL